MAEKKRNKLVDYGLQIVRELIGGNTEDAPKQDAAAKPIKLEDLKLDDLRREKIRLDQEERKMLAKMRDLESRKRKLFEEGVRNVSEREQRVIARQIKELDLEAQNIDQMLGVISKQTRIMNGLIKVKDNERLMSQSGVSSILQNIDLGDLIKFIDKASVDGEFHMDKFDELLGTLEGNESLRRPTSEDQDVLDIMSQMQQARESMETQPEEVALDEAFTEMDKNLQEKPQDDLESFEEDF